MASGVTFSGSYENCITTDPSFISATTDAGNTYDALNPLRNWKLNTSSVCINSGITAANTSSYDLAGKNRVLNGIIDIGAYENLISKTTYGGGNISGLVRWMADTIVVNNSFTINNNGTLTIDPGVTVLFTGNYKISCNGLLKAIGNSNSRITFTRSTVGGWSGFDFNKDDTEDDTSQFLYCNFKNLSGQITVDDRNKFKMDNNIFESSVASSSMHCIVITNSIAQFSSNEFKTMSNYATLIRVDFSTVNLSRNRIHDISGQEAISVNESEMNLMHTKIFNYTCSSTLIRCYNSKGNICNNLIFNNTITYNGISFDNAWSNFYIANNTIARNSVGSMLLYILNALVENNIVVNNSNNTLWSFYLYPSIFRNNYVTSNDASGGCSDCIIDSYPMFVSPTFVTGVSTSAADADWHISLFSRAINKGYADVSKLPLTDLDGNPRIADNKVDMGVYEYKGSLSQFTTQPEGGTYCNGDSVVLTIAITDTAIFQWQFNGKNINGATNDTLILRNVTSAEQGNYTCKAITGFGTATSNAALININTSPEILSTPESRFVTPGSPVGIEVPVSGAKPISIKWYKDDIFIPILNKAELRFPSFGAVAEGSYKMIAENTCGTDTSSEFSLNLLPNSIIKNNDTLLCEGELVTLITKASSGSTFKWFKNGNEVSGASSDTLKFLSIEKDDEGSYTCLVVSKAGTVETGSLLINVRQSPEITASPTSSFTTVGADIKASVTSSGSSPLFYKWFKDGNQIPGFNKAIQNIPGFNNANQGVYKVVVQNICGTDTTSNFGLYLEPKIAYSSGTASFCTGNRTAIKILKSFTGEVSWYLNGDKISGETKDSLVISSLTKANEGTYQCYISTVYGNVSSNQLYLVASQAPEFTTQPSSEWVANNSSVTAEVLASGSSPLVYQWYRNDLIMNGENSSRLLFAGFTANDEKVYKCIVSNLCGKDTSKKAAFMITPNIILNTTNGEPVVCENATVELSVSSSFSASYQWKKDGQNISSATSSILSLSNVSEISKGNYTCVVSNKYGQTETTPVFLQVLSKPVITTDPSSEWVYSGSTYNLKMVIEGSKPLKYKWFRNNVLTTDTLSNLTFDAFGKTNEGKYVCVVSNSCGTDTTSSAKLLVAPELENPSGSLVCEKDTFNLSVLFNDSATIQWYKDGSLLANTTGKKFIISKVEAKNIGNYSCRVSNKNGYVILGPVQLLISKAPTVEPLEAITYVNKTLVANITTNTSGDEPITYQWLKNGIIMSGKTGETLELIGIQATDEANYSCKVSNTCGSLETNPTKLVIAPQICMVTNAMQNDSNKNLLIWDRNSKYAYKYYTVYREGSVAGQYQTIGKVPYKGVTVFIDTFVNPKSQAYVYKITATDSSGLETDINATAQHKTIHLLVTQGIPSGIQLDWDDYIGFDYGTYNIYRSTDNSAFVKVHDMASTSRTWIDFDAPTSQALKYYVTVSRAQSCSANDLRKAGAGPLSSAISNMEDNSRLRSTSVATNKVDTRINIYPNPFFETAVLNYKLTKQSDVKIVISDLSGQQISVLTHEKQSPGQYNLSFGDKLSSGLYFINMTVDGQKMKYKIVKL